ncbi:MAG: rRNA maturation RNase YbeY [Candidatus Kapaibacterium sp.]
MNIYNESGHKYIPKKMIQLAVLLTAEKELKKDCDISIVICNDDYIHDLNIRYLQHDYPTDVITFEIDDEPLTGEIYISADTAKLQAEEYKVSFRDELMRLAVHGTLHLAGHLDNTDELRKRMSELEDKYLKEIKA